MIQYLCLVNKENMPNTFYWTFWSQRLIWGKIKVIYEYIYDKYN